MGQGRQRSGGESKGINMSTNMRNLKLINKIKKSGVAKQGSMAKEMDEFHAKGMEPKPTRKKPQSSTAKSLADIRKRANEAKVDEISVDKMMDYKQRAKYSRDKASNSQAAHALRGTDPSKDKDTERKRNRGLKTFDKVAAKKVRNSLMKKEDYKSEYAHHTQGLKDAKADMKAAKTNSDMVKAMNKKAHHSKALSKMNRMESVEEARTSSQLAIRDTNKRFDRAKKTAKKDDDNSKYRTSKSGNVFVGLKKEEVEYVNEMGPRHTSKPMKSRFGGAVDSKKFDTYKKFVKQRNVDEPTVRMVIDNPNDAESKRMMKNANIAKAVELRKAAMKESISEKLSVSDGMGAWIDDFKKSDAPQFKGKNDKERKDMAIAAYLSAKKGEKQEGYVSMAQQRAVWATRKDGGKGHPDNKGKKKK